MKSWELAAEKFLQPYLKEDYFVGAILTGSYATGNNHRNSDIDIFIITKQGTPWRERGNRMTDGFMVEYFINPVNQVLAEFEDGFATNNITTTLMFAGSKILYDKDSTVARLVSQAKQDLTKEIKPASGFRYNTNCYTVWHSFYEVDSKYTRGEDFDFSYNIFIKNVIDAYFANKGIPAVSAHKIERILADIEYRLKYNAVKMPEEEFCLLLLKCFDEKDYTRKYLCAKEIYEYFMAKHPDFDISNFSFRSNL